MRIACLPHYLACMYAVCLKKKENLSHQDWQKSADRNFFFSFYVSGNISLLTNQDTSHLLFAISVPINLCLRTIVPMYQQTIQHKRKPSQSSSSLPESSLTTVNLHFLLTHCTIKTDMRTFLFLAICPINLQ